MTTNIVVNAFPYHAKPFIPKSIYQAYEQGMFDEIEACLAEGVTPNVLEKRVMDKSRYLALEFWDQLYEKSLSKQHLSINTASDLGCYENYVYESILNVFPSYIDFVKREDFNLIMALHEADEKSNFSLYDLMIMNVNQILLYPVFLKMHELKIITLDDETVEVFSLLKFNFDSQDIKIKISDLRGYMDERVDLFVNDIKHIVHSDSNTQEIDYIIQKRSELFSIECIQIMDQIYRKSKIKISSDVYLLLTMMKNFDFIHSNIMDTVFSMSEITEINTEEYFDEKNYLYDIVQIWLSNHFKKAVKDRMKDNLN